MARTALLAAACLALAACASVQVDPQQRVAATLAPFETKIGLLAGVSVPAGSPLVAASLDGKPAFCTVKPAYYAVGESRPICFTDDTNSGVFSRYYILGTLRSLTYEASVPYAISTQADIAAFKQQAVAEHLQTAAREANCRQQQAMITALRPGFSPAQVADSTVAQAVFYEKCIRGF
jgi:hypothetical protein